MTNENQDEYGGKIGIFSFLVKSKNGPLSLLVIGLLACIGVLIYLTVMFEQHRDENRKLEHASLGVQLEALRKAELSTETQNRISNWLLSLKPENRPQLNMPIEAYGLLTEEAKVKMLEDYKRRRGE